MSSRVHHQPSRFAEHRPPTVGVAQPFAYSGAGEPVRQGRRELEPGDGARVGGWLGGAPDARECRPYRREVDALPQMQDPVTVRPYTWLLDRVGEGGITLTGAGYLPPVHGPPTKPPWTRTKFVIARRVVGGLCRNALDGALRHAVIARAARQGIEITDAIAALDKSGYDTRRRAQHVLDLAADSDALPQTARCLRQL